MASSTRRSNKFMRCLLIGEFHVPAGGFRIAERLPHGRLSHPAVGVINELRGNVRASLCSVHELDVSVVATVHHMTAAGSHQTDPIDRHLRNHPRLAQHRLQTDVVELAGPQACDCMRKQVPGRLTPPWSPGRAKPQDHGNPALRSPSRRKRKRSGRGRQVAPATGRAFSEAACRESTEYCIKCHVLWGDFALLIGAARGLRVLEPSRILAVFDLLKGAALFGIENAHV
jgi:hypothetical protein